MRLIRTCCTGGGESSAGVETAFPGLGKRRASEENRLAELERKIGQQTLEIDFLRRVLQRVEDAFPIRPY